jgi:hypothetical protein
MPANSGLRNGVVKQKTKRCSIKNSSVPMRDGGAIKTPTNKRSGNAKVHNGTVKRG